MYVCMYVQKFISIGQLSFIDNVTKTFRGFFGSPCSTCLINALF